MGKIDFIEISIEKQTDLFASNDAHGEKHEEL